MLVFFGLSRESGLVCESEKHSKVWIRIQVRAINICHMASYGHGNVVENGETNMACVIKSAKRKLSDGPLII